MSREISHDRQDIDFKGAKISIVEKDRISRTHIIAEEREGFRPPLVENWVSDAIVFLTATLVYPRLTIRHFDTTSFVFVRAFPSDSRSGMPAPIAFNNLSNTWDLFSLFLSKCEEGQHFEAIDLTRIFQEVILASTGTVQAFVLSLALASRISWGN
ncbi:MAG TPA: hypothetical protein VJ784_04625 [Pyrinomonadaceae bacterium]|nr:hypothetical protein [Pyrinomonadaceae bacterium]